MTTHAWKGFIHSWHQLGQVLKWMCIVVVGIPFAAATCVLVAAAVLLFAFLCLAAAFAAGAFVFYCLKGAFYGIKALIRFIEDHKAHLQTLPTSTSSNHKWKKASMVVPLQSWGTTKKANQISDPSEPVGYIYPWYEGNPDEPAQAHLGPEENHQSPRPASNINSTIENDSSTFRVSDETISNPDSASHRKRSASDPAANFVPYCKVCHKAKPRPQFPSRKITSRCNHQPSICLSCLSDSIKRDSDPELSTWSRICCPLCNVKLQTDDMKEFGSGETSETYEPASSTSTPYLPDIKDLASIFASRASLRRAGGTVPTIDISSSTPNIDVPSQKKRHLYDFEIRR